MAQNFNNTAPQETSTKDDLLTILYDIIDSRFVNDEMYSRIGRVVSVDQAGATCSVDVVNGDNISDVRLQQMASSGLLIVPAVDSVVTITYISPTVAYVGNYSQIDSIVFQNGENGGLIKIDQLITEIQDTKTKINDLITVFTNWTPAPSDGGAALKTALATWLLTNLPNVDRDSLENTNFTH